MKQVASHYFLVIFLGLLPFSLLLSSLAWHLLITNRMYVCSDSVPILSFVPPWVHSQVPQDYYVIHPILLLAVWIFFVGMIFFAPYEVAKKLAKGK